MPDPDLLVPALAALAVLSPLAVLVRDRRRTVTPSTEAARALRHATLPAATATAVLLLGLLAVAMWVVFYQPFGGSFRPGGRALACMPLAAALAFLLVHAVGELTYPRPTGDVRTAALTTRTAADVAPRRLRRTTSAWAAGLGVVLLVGTLTATGPRHLDRTVDGWISRGGPYPGTWYAVPLTIGAVLVLLATWGVLHLVATRPAVSGVDPAWDHALRCSTGARVLRGVQLALALTLGGMLVVAAWGVQGAAQPMPALGPHTASPVLGVVGAVLGILAVAVCVAGVVLALPRGAARPAATLTEAPA